jgi:hypothetical protein
MKRAGNVTHGKAEIYYKKSTDSGDSWTAAKQLSYDDGRTAFPCLVG